MHWKIENSLTNSFLHFNFSCYSKHLLFGFKMKIIIDTIKGYLWERNVSRISENMAHIPFQFLVVVIPEKFLRGGWLVSTYVNSPLSGKLIESCTLVLGVWGELQIIYCNCIPPTYPSVVLYSIYNFLCEVFSLFFFSGFFL